jgi:hypothetical protein
LFLFSFFLSFFLSFSFSFSSLSCLFEMSFIFFLVVWSEGYLLCLCVRTDYNNWRWKCNDEFRYKLWSSFCLCWCRELAILSRRCHHWVHHFSLFCFLLLFLFFFFDYLQISDYFVFMTETVGCPSTTVYS